MGAPPGLCRPGRHLALSSGDNDIADCAGSGSGFSRYTASTSSIIPAEMARKLNAKQSITMWSE